MDTYANISKELKNFFSQNAIFKVLLPLDCVLYLGAYVYRILQLVPGVNDIFLLRGMFSDVIYYMGIIGLFLVYANRKDQILALGFFMHAVMSLVWILIDLIRYQINPFGNILDMLVYALIGFLILKRSYKNSSVMEG